MKGVHWVKKGTKIIWNFKIGWFYLWNNPVGGRNVTSFHVSRASRFDWRRRKDLSRSSWFSATPSGLESAARASSSTWQSRPFSSRSPPSKTSTSFTLCWPVSGSWSGSSLFLTGFKSSATSFGFLSSRAASDVHVKLELLSWTQIRNDAFLLTWNILLANNAASCISITFILQWHLINRYITISFVGEKMNSLSRLWQAFSKSTVLSYYQNCQ